MRSLSRLIICTHVLHGIAFYQRIADLFDILITNLSFSLLKTDFVLLSRQMEEANEDGSLLDLHDLGFSLIFCNIIFSPQVLGLGILLSVCDFDELLDDN